MLLKLFKIRGLKATQWSIALWFRWALKTAVNLPKSLLCKCKSDPKCQKRWQMSNMKELGISASTIDVTLWKLWQCWMNKITQQLPELFQKFSEISISKSAVQKSEVLHKNIGLRWLFMFFFSVLLGNINYKFPNIVTAYILSEICIWTKVVMQQMVWPTQRYDLIFMKSIWGYVKRQKQLKLKPKSKKSCGNFSKMLER